MLELVAKVENPGSNEILEFMKSPRGLEENTCNRLGGFGKSL
jgi:hypothetical protein